MEEENLLSCSRDQIQLSLYLEAEGQVKDVNWSQSFRQKTGSYVTT